MSKVKVKVKADQVEEIHLQMRWEILLGERKLKNCKSQSQLIQSCLIKHAHYNLINNMEEKNQG